MLRFKSRSLEMHVFTFWCRVFCVKCLWYVVSSLSFDTTIGHAIMKTRKKAFSWLPEASSICCSDLGQRQLQSTQLQETIHSWNLTATSSLLQLIWQGLQNWISRQRQEKACFFVIIVCVFVCVCVCTFQWKESAGRMACMTSNTSDSSSK